MIRQWDEKREADYQRRIWSLAVYTKNHPDPRGFAERLRKRHGEALIQKMREALRNPPPPPLPDSLA